VREIEPPAGPLDYEDTAGPRTTHTRDSSASRGMGVPIPRAAEKRGPQARIPLFPRFSECQTLGPSGGARLTRPRGWRGPAARTRGAADPYYVPGASSLPLVRTIFDQPLGQWPAKASSSGSPKTVSAQSSVNPGV
jgi:hypothetical protein